MVHSGYEATAVKDAIKRPWHIAQVALTGPKVEGVMAPEIDLSQQRQAKYDYNEQVAELMKKLPKDSVKKRTAVRRVKKVAVQEA